MSLKRYIQDQMKQGHSIEVLRAHCIEHGYTPEQVDEALGIDFKPLPVSKLFLETIFMVVLLSSVAFIAMWQYSPVDTPIYTDKRTVSYLDNYEPNSPINRNLRRVAAIIETPDPALLTFEEHFLSCTQTIQQIQVTNGITYQHQILGPTRNGCRVISKFIQHTNPEVLGKEMICLYDNALPFTKAQLEREKCAGPLVSYV